jgi:metal-responsive CopG/Arc/MetJ family transcriptional regulator
LCRAYPRMQRRRYLVPKVKIDKGLLEKVKKYSKLAGYSSPDEFVAHALEKELASFEESDSEEEIKKKLEGLGYIS